jgi:carboxypeptidase family protein
MNHSLSFVRRALPGLLLAILAGLPTAAHAQTIRGRVLDSVNERPVDGVIVALVTRDGEAKVQALSDAGGNFVIVPPEAGEYILVTTGFGYLETRSPLLALVMEGEAPIELMISPSPIGLEGLEISVEESAAEDLNIMGLSANQLGRRWITSKQIDAIQVKRDMGVILELTSQSGIRIIRPENLTMGSENMGLCVSMQRGRTATGRGTCALVVLNGVPISGVQALNIDTEAIESMALLTPTEAAFQYGTLGGAGAVLVWTRAGR